MRTYDFNQQLQRGIQGERFLDRYFSERYRIENASQTEQRQGIDRYFSDSSGNRFSVEYKTDWIAQHSHNAFIETVSVDSVGKQGWGTQSRAFRLAYYVPGEDAIYWLLMSAVRNCIPYWSQHYPVKKAQNVGYATHGIAIPLTELERHAEFVFTPPPFR